jgi:S-(hydroxymethyl)glutathione dehydrogenase / alcohol dehydrogenase
MSVGSTVVSGAEGRAATPIQMRACVLREPGSLGTETVTLAAPKLGEVRVRMAAAGVCHSDLSLADGKLGEGRWPMVLGHEGAGVIDALGPGVSDELLGARVVLAMIVPCGQCESCRRGNRTLCEPAGARSYDGVLSDDGTLTSYTGSSRLTGQDGETLQHGISVACFAEYVVVPAAAVVPVPDSVPLWLASLIGCGVVTGFGAVSQAARVQIGERVCVIGCGGVGLQAITAAKIAGAGQVIAVDLQPEKLEQARQLGATHTVLSDGPDPAAEVRELSSGGVDHAFEVVGLPVTMRLAWDTLRPGGAAVVVGLAARGAEVSLPAIEMLSEKRIIGSYYGSGDPGLSLRTLIGLADDGRLNLAEVVSHRIELDGIGEAFERLRHGEGNRSVVIINPELAEASAGATS